MGEGAGDVVRQASGAGSKLKQAEGDSGPPKQSKHGDKEEEEEEEEQRLGEADVPSRRRGPSTARQ